MAFIVDNIHLSEDMEQGAEIGLLFSTTILEAASGVETPNENWSQGKHQGTFSYGVMDQDELLAMKAFQAGRRGKARGFLLKNWSDYEMARDTIATGDGATLSFPILKTYDDAVNPYLHYITRPVTSTLQVWVNNVLKSSPGDYSFATATGITFVSAPANGHLIEVACEFDLPVRFSDDYFPLNVIYAGAASVPTFGFVEISEYVQSL